MSLGHPYQIEWGPANQPQVRQTVIVFADNPEEADLKARQVLSKAYPGKYVYTVLRVVRSGTFEVLPDKDFEKPG